MTRLFDDAGTHVPVTVLSLDGCQVTAQRTQEKDGTSPSSSGDRGKKARTPPRPCAAHFAKGPVEPKRFLAKFRSAKTI